MNCVIGGNQRLIILVSYISINKINFVSMQHIVQFIMVPELRLKFNLHLRNMLLELLQELKHLRSIALELEDLSILTMYLFITNLSNEGKVILDACKVILRRKSGQERDLSLKVCKVRSQKYGELLRLKKIWASGSLFDE